MPSQSSQATKDRLNALSHRVIGVCMEVHREIGPGLLESAYEEALAYEFTQANLSFERQREMPLLYKGAKLDCGYRLDFVIEGELILEIKAVQEVLPVHHAQLLTYLKLERRSLGLLVNFNVPALKQGIRRVVSGDLFTDKRNLIARFGASLILLCVAVGLWVETWW
jgi:GxxExxY protein